MICLTSQNTLVQIPEAGSLFISTIHDQPILDQFMVNVDDLKKLWIVKKLDLSLLLITILSKKDSSYLSALVQVCTGTFGCSSLPAEIASSDGRESTLQAG